MDAQEIQSKQVEEIDDIIKGMVPDAPVETVVEPVAVGGDKGEIKEDKVEEGEKRIEEEAVRQEQDGEVKKVDDLLVVPDKPVEAVKPVVEETEIDKIKRENAELRAHLNEVAERAMTPKPERPKTEVEEAAEKAQKEAAGRQILKFLPTEEVFDEAMKNANNFNALLTAVVNTAVERSLRMIPQVATQLVEQQISLKDIVRSFYDENKDLVEHKKYVGFVSNEVAAQHPDWTLPKILEETEKEVRSRLRLTRVAQTNIELDSRQIDNTSRTAQVRNPGFVPSGGGGRRGSGSGDGNLTPQEKDIMSLIS
jgi:hypothetical protein